MNDQNQNNGYPNYNNSNYYNSQNGYNYNQQPMNQNNMYYYQNPYYYPQNYPNYQNVQYNQYQNYPQYPNLNYQNYYNQQYYNNMPNNNANLNNIQNEPKINKVDDTTNFEEDIPANMDPIEETESSNNNYVSNDNSNNIYKETNNTSINNEYDKEKQEFREVLQKAGINPDEFIHNDETPKPSNEMNTNQKEEKVNDEKIEEIAEVIKEGKVEEKQEVEKPKFSVLERYGEDLTNKEYVTNPAIAREDEIRKLILVLLTPDKSACLVGKPGIGKTAIVEGLAYRIMRNDVPNVLKGYKIVNVATSSLLGESVSDGERDSRIQLLVQEVMNMDKIILFIDEIHTLMGAGAKEGSSLDFANILKPALARGNVKLIGATTSDEYERYMIRDRAFIRRFEKIDVAEPDIPTTVKILMGSYPRIEKKTGVRLIYSDYIKEKLMTFLVEMTSEYKRFYELSSRYPDISLALLSKAFSFAIYENSNVVRLRHFWLAINTCNSIYPDSRAKEVERFKVVFADLIKEENLDVNAPIDVE